MSQVTDYLKQRFPELKDEPEYDLTLYFGQKMPEFLEDPEFKDRFDSYNAIHNQIQIDENVTVPAGAPESNLEPIEVKPGGEFSMAIETPPEPQVSQEQIQRARAVSEQTNYRYEMAKTPEERQNALLAGQQQMKELGISTIRPMDVELPRMEGESVSVGVYNAIANFANFFVTPEGTMTLGLGAFAPSTMRLIAGYFFTQMAVHAPETFKSLVQSWQEGTPAEKAESTINAAGHALFTWLTGKHAIFGGKGRPEIKIDNEGFAKFLEERVGAEEALKVLNEVKENQAEAGPAALEKAGAPLTADAVRQIQSTEVENAIPKPSATEVHVRETPGNRQAMGEEVRRAEEPAKAEEAPKEVTPVEPEKPVEQPPPPKETGAPTPGQPPDVSYLTVEGMAKRRASVGKGPTLDPERQRQVELDRQVKERVLAEPNYLENLVTELSRQPRVVSAAEHHALNIYYEMLQKSQLDAMKRGDDAFASGDEAAIKNAKAAFDDYEQKLSDFEQKVGRAVGTEWGRSGAMMQRGLNRDYSLAGITRRWRAAQEFKPLTEEQVAEAAAMAKRLDDLRKEYEKLESEDQVRAVDREIARAKQDIDKTRPQYSQQVLDIAEKIVKGLEARAEAAKADLRKRLSQLGAGVDPMIITDLARIMAAKVARFGLTKAKAFADVVKEFGDKVQPFLEQAWERVENELESSTKGASKTVRKVVRQERKAEVGDLIEDAIAKIERAAEKDALDTLFRPVQQLVRGILEENPKISREELIDRVHETLRQYIPDMTRLDAMDMISGRGRFTLPRQDDVSVRMRDLKTQIRLIGHQLDLRAGKKELPRTGPQRDKMSDEARREQQKLNEMMKELGVETVDPASQLRGALQALKTYYKNRLADLKYEIQTRERTVRKKSLPPEDPELKALKEEYDRTKAKHDEIFGRRELNDAQRLNIAIKAAERSLKEWEQRLENAKKGIFSTLKKKGVEVTSQELKDIRARTQKIRDQVNTLHDLANPKLTPEQRALKMAKRRAEKKLENLKTSLAEDRFEKRKRTEYEPDEELIKLQSEIEKVQEKVNARMAELHWAQLSPFEKAKEGAIIAYDNARILMTSFEFSYFLRQGKLYFAIHPFKAIKAFKDSLKALTNEDFARASELRIVNDPLYRQSQIDGLHISRRGESLTHQEELRMGQFSDALPGIRHFSRAAVMFLNQIRFDAYKSLRKTLPRGKNVPPDEGQTIATFVNEMTGRGKLGKTGEPGALLLARIFFAPRYLASRFQMLAGHTLWRALMRGQGQAAKLIAIEYARILVGLGLYTVLLKTAIDALAPDGRQNVKLTLDSRSSDFMKLVIGQTRLDLLAGLGQVAVFGMRTISGEMKTTKGKVQPLRGKVPYGQSNWWDIATRFARTKAHPIPGTVVNLLSGIDLVGNVVTPEGEVIKWGVPITYLDVFQAMRDLDVPQSVALSLLALLGEGLQTYKPKNK